MNAGLERRHRRLLALYPPRHRERYGDEMLGTLAAGAPAGARWPGPGTVADLLRGAATAWARAVRGSDELAAAGLIALAALSWLSVTGAVTVTTGEINSSYGRPGMAAMWLGYLVWLPIAVAALAGARRSAGAAAWVLGVALPVLGGVVTEVADWYPGYVGGLIGGPWDALALVAAVSLTWSAGPRTGVRVLARGTRDRLGQDRAA